MAEREAIGSSSAWLHHKGRNKHHYEYWIDYSTKEIKGGMAPAKMPEKYVVEMLMDPLAYYMKGRENAPIHPETKALLECLLTMLAEEGEEETFAYIRQNILHRKH